MPMFFDKAGQPIPQTKRPVKAYKNISDFAYKYDQLLKPPANQIVSLANFSTNLRVQSLSAAPAALGNFSTVGGRIAADFNSINGVANRNMALPSFAITNSTAEAMVTAAPEPNGSSAQVTVEGLEMPANPGASVDVYINAFEDEKDVTNSALHLAGRIWFFGGHEHMATMGGASYTIDISDALARLKFASRLRTGKIQPQLVTTLPDGRRGPPPKVNGAIKVEISS